jgi:hypothetical protein
MSKLNRFFASFLLIISLSVVAFADGGETQGPSITYSDEPGVTTPQSDPTTTENTSTVLDALKATESVTVWWLTEVI